MIALICCMFVPSILAAAPTSAPCRCMPRQWNSEMLQLGAHINGFNFPEQDENVMTVNYDSVNQFTRIDIEMDDDIFISLRNYNNNKTYSWLQTDNRCNVTMIDRPQQAACVPDDAIVEGIYRIGGTQGFMVKTFVYKQGQGTVRFTATVDDCTPVSRSLIGPVSSLIEFSRSVQTFLFGEISYGSKKAGMFDIPSECMKAEAAMMQGGTTQITPVAIGK